MNFATVFANPFVAAEARLHRRGHRARPTRAPPHHHFSPPPSKTNAIYESTQENTETFRYERNGFTRGSSRKRGGWYVA